MVSTRSSIFMAFVFMVIAKSADSVEDKIVNAVEKVINTKLAQFKDECVSEILQQCDMKDPRAFLKCFDEHISPIWSRCFIEDREERNRANTPKIWTVVGPTEKIS